MIPIIDLKLLIIKECRRRIHEMRDKDLIIWAKELKIKEIKKEIS